MCSPLNRVVLVSVFLAIVAACLLHGQRPIDALEPLDTSSQETSRGSQKGQEETAQGAGQWSWGQKPTLDESRELFEIEASEEMGALDESEELVEIGVLESLKQCGRFPVFTTLPLDDQLATLRRLLHLRNVRQEAAHRFSPEEEAYLTERFPSVSECLKAKRDRSAASTGALESLRFAAYEFEIYLGFLAVWMRSYEKDSPQLAMKLREPLELSFQAEILGQRFRNSKDDRERNTIKEQIRAVLTNSFDLFTECRELETELAEAELGKVRALLEKAQTNGGAPAETASREAAVAQVEAGIRASRNLLEERRTFRDIIIEHYLLVLLYSDVLGENFMW